MWVIDSEGSLGRRKTGLMGDTFRVVTWVDPQTGVEYLIFEDFSINSSGGEDVIIVTRGKNAVFNRVLKLPQSHKTTNWCAT